MREGRRRGWLSRGILALALLAAGCAFSPAPPPLFRISVVDAETGRGIPAVELRSVDGRSFYTDSAGMIALGEPVLMNRAAFFQALSFGYRCEEEVHGWRGATFEVVPGGSAVLRMQRENVAERLYRVTGAGVYRDSLLLGDAIPRPEPAHGALPAGADSVLTTVYRGALFWVWGDTTLLSAPIGIFRATAATSPLPDGGLDPASGIALDYLRDGAGLRAMIDDPHPVIWLSALRAARDAGGEERLFATYRKVVADLRTLETGLAELDEARGVFRLVSAHPADAPIVPDGHVLRYRENGVAFLQYDMDVRGLDEAEAVRDLASYQAFTPFRPGARLADGARALERDARGRLVWGWKRDAPAVPPARWDALVADGAVAPAERPYRLIDVETGEAIVPHNGSIQWNEFRRRWIMIRGQSGGSSSPLGEIYYFEGDTPLGPWAYGRKIITHARDVIDPLGRSVRETYSFYNPLHHPELDRAGGREIFVEGTLATSFAHPAAPRIPAYDYNQMMYRLRLDDARLFLPVPVYRLAGDPPRYRTREALGEDPPAEIVFFAPDRPRPGTVAVREVPAGRRLVVGGAEGEGPVRFHCAAGETAPPGSVPLYEESDARGSFRYTTGPPSRAASLVCHVWPAPVDFAPLLRVPTASAVGYAGAAGPGSPAPKPASAAAGSASTAGASSL